MISDIIKKAIIQDMLLFRAKHFYFSEIGVGHNEGDTDAEFLIGIGKYRSHFEVHGINEMYIKPNFNIETRSKILHKQKDRIEIVFDWKLSKNSENEPTSLDYIIKDNKITGLKFWFMVGPGLSAHIRSISFDVESIRMCNNCYKTYDIDLHDE